VGWCQVVHGRGRGMLGVAVPLEALFLPPFDRRVVVAGNCDNCYAWCLSGVLNAHTAVRPKGMHLVVVLLLSYLRAMWDA
jgi:hypothetical protein